MTEIITVIMTHNGRTMIACVNPYIKAPAFKKIIDWNKKEDKETATVNAMLLFLSMMPKETDHPVIARIVMPLTAIKSINPIVRQFLCKTVNKNNFKIIFQSYTSLNYSSRSDNICREMISYMWSVLNK